MSNILHLDHKLGLINSLAKIRVIISVSSKSCIFYFISELAGTLDLCYISFSFLVCYPRNLTASACLIPIARLSTSFDECSTSPKINPRTSDHLILDDVVT